MANDDRFPQSLGAKRSEAESACGNFEILLNNLLLVNIAKKHHSPDQQIKGGHIVGKMHKSGDAN